MQRDPRGPSRIAQQAPTPVASVASGAAGFGAALGGIGGGGGGGESREREKLQLIQQVLQLTPEQINTLPEDQKRSILDLKEQLKSKGRN